jgi:hypothetical protein
VSSVSLEKGAGERLSLRGAVVVSGAAVILTLAAPVAQLDRVTASEAVGCAFEPRRAHKNRNRDEW